MQVRSGWGEAGGVPGTDRVVGWAMTEKTPPSVSQNAGFGWAFYGLHEVIRFHLVSVGAGERQGLWQVSGGGVGHQGSPASVGRFRGHRRPQRWP